MPALFFRLAQRRPDRSFEKNSRAASSVLNGPTVSAQKCVNSSKRRSYPHKLCETDGSMREILQPGASSKGTYKTKRSTPVPSEPTEIAKITFHPLVTHRGTTLLRHSFGRYLFACRQRLPEELGNDPCGAHYRDLLSVASGHRRRKNASDSQSGH